MKIKLLKHSGYEQVACCEDSASGLKAYIAVHNTRLGPALGGIRMYPYDSENDAIADALRLSRAMSYKSAAAHLRLGGGKSVIIGHPGLDKTPEKLRAMGRFVEELGGKYWAAKDAGIQTDDLLEVAKETEFVTGLPESMGGSGDPSPWTAIGIHEGMRACIREALGTDSFKGLHVAVQGVGHVGLAVAKHVIDDGARVTLTDVNAPVLDSARQALKAEAVSPEAIFDIDCDVFAPCALGGAVNDDTIERLKCKVIAGGANNQLADETRHGKRLQERGILYAPDYILNAGGVINIFVKDILKEKDVMPWIRNISKNLSEIFSLARETGQSPSQQANLLTEDILSGVKSI